MISSFFELPSVHIPQTAHEWMKADFYVMDVDRNPSSIIMMIKTKKPRHYTASKDSTYKEKFFFIYELEQKPDLNFHFQDSTPKNKSS